MINRYPIRKSP